MKGLKARLSKAKNYLVEKWKAFLAEAQCWIEAYEKRVFLILVGSILIALILWLVPKWQTHSLRASFYEVDIRRLEPKERIELAKDLAAAENNARVTLAQIIGGLVVLLGLHVMFKNVRVAEEGKLTERFSKAVELLGSDKLDVRLGGIYALERIARDSQKDHWTVMEVLTAFVREHSPAEYKKMEPRTTNDLESHDPGSDKPEEGVREDIQAALSAIDRRKWVKQEKLGHVIKLSRSFLKKANLSGSNLSGAYLIGTNLSGAGLVGAILNRANLSGANLGGANLREADLREANLIGANLFVADLIGANLHGANLSKANLFRANLGGANLREVNFSGAILQGANLKRAYLSGANLRDVIRLTWEEIAEAIIDKTTKLPPELEEWRKADHKNKAK